MLLNEMIIYQLINNNCSKHIVIILVVLFYDSRFKIKQIYNVIKINLL